MKHRGAEGPEQLCINIQALALLRGPWMWNCVEKCTLTSGSLCLGRFSDLTPHPLSLSTVRHVSLFAGKSKVQPLIFTQTAPPIPCTLFNPSHISQSSHPISIFTLKSTILYIYIMIIPDFFFFYCECFCAAPPSYSVVYWLLSCGMFVLSQSNVVFTLKPHFS